MAQIIRDVAQLRGVLEPLRAQGTKVGVVPTMGALHEGHLSLVAEAKRHADVVVVTIFVNPTQFGPNEDFEKYPRDLERDTALVDGAGGDIVFSPAVQDMYPNGEVTRVSVPQVSDGLCGAHRPGHFVGVATVVAKLFNAVGPGIYVFGKKDFQQLKVIQRMALDLLFPVEIVGAPIVRAEDGLALSSRNVYLSASERAVAPGLARGLFHAQLAYKGGERSVAQLISVATTAIEDSATSAAAFEIEYLEIRDATSLSADLVDASGQIQPPDRRIVLLVAARLGTTRLIDNLELVD